MSVQNHNVSSSIKGDSVLQFGVGRFDVGDANAVAAPAEQHARQKSADKSEVPAKSAAPGENHQGSSSEGQSMYMRNISQANTAALLANGGQRATLVCHDVQMLGVTRAPFGQPNEPVSNVRKDMAQISERKRTEFNIAQHQLRQIVEIEECEMPSKGFKHIIGCADVVSELSLNYVLPCNYPSLFGLFSMPWTNILLYGPCGSGKKTMAKCLAAERKGTFVSIHAASLLAASYEKLDIVVGALFQFASQKLPIVIYIQDMDVLFTVNDEVTGFTNRILFMLASHKSRIEGRTKHGDVMMVAGSSCDLNNLNPYASKVFRKTIEVALPGTTDRIKLLRQFLTYTKHELNENDFEKLGEETVGLTAGALESVVREARLVPIQKIFEARFFKRIEVVLDNAFASYWIPCEENQDGAIRMTYSEVRPKDEVFLPPVSADMIRDSIRKINSINGSSPSKSIGRLRHTYTLLEKITKIDNPTGPPEPEMPVPFNPEVKAQADAPPPEERRRAWYEQLFDCFK